MMAIILALGLIFWTYKHNKALRASALKAPRTLNRQTHACQLMRKTQLLLTANRKNNSKTIKHNNNNNANITKIVTNSH